MLLRKRGEGFNRVLNFHNSIIIEVSKRSQPAALDPLAATVRLFLQWVTGCRDDASRATDGLPSAADAPLQRSELAKSATYGLMHRSKLPALGSVSYRLPANAFGLGILKRR